MLTWGKNDPCRLTYIQIFSSQHITNTSSDGLIIPMAAGDERKLILNIQRVSLVFFQTPCPSNQLRGRWKWWLVAPLYLKRGVSSSEWPRDNHGWVSVHSQVGHLITNLIGLCQVTGAVILHSSDFRKALWYICFNAEDDSLSDQLQEHFMINYIQGEVKIMGPPKCQHEVSPRWRMAFLFWSGFISWRVIRPRGAGLIVVISYTTLCAEKSFWDAAPSHDDCSTVIIKHNNRKERKWVSICWLHFGGWFYVKNLEQKYFSK